MNNIHQLAAEKAEKKYPIYEDLDANQTDVQNIRRAAYISAWQDCLNHLARSEGGVTDDDIACSFRLLEIGATEKAYSHMHELIKQHTATHVAKVLSQQWISVEDRLPEEAGYYVVYDAGLYEVNTYYYLDGFFRERKGRLELDKEIVTHWQPLPTPPINEPIK